MIDDIRYLIVFAKVAEMGSLSGAADALDLTAATVSAHLARLEKNLGAALLYRNTRKLSLTADGRDLLETAGAMLALYEKGIIEFRQRAVATTDALRVAMPAILINCPVFMDELGRFVRRSPGLRLELRCSDLRSDVIGDGIDVAFRIGDLPDSALKARPVFAFARTVVASRALLDEHASVAHPAGLAALPWIGLSMRPDRRTFRHADGGAHEIRYTPRVQVDNVEAAYALALRGVGLAAPPDFLARADLAQGRVERVLPDWSLDPLQVHALWPANVAPSSAAYALIHALHRALEPAQSG